MKKHLIALAVGSALAIPAVAQNVTIYGVVDAGLLNLTNTTATGGSTMSMGSGLHTSSRFGVRGSEDLGGGLSARFTLESSLAHDAGMLGNGFTAGSGTALDANTTSSQKLFDRQATVGLAQGAFSADFGRQNNLTAATAALVDPQGFVYTGFGPNVAILGLAAVPNSQNYGNASQTAGCTSLTSTTALTAANCRNLFRLDNAARFNYSAAGVNLSAMWGLGETAGNSSAASSTGLSANGKLGAITLAAAYTTVKDRTPATAQGTALTTNILGATLPVSNTLTLKVTTGKTSGNETMGKYTVSGLGADYTLSPAGVVTLSMYKVSNANAIAASAGGYNQIGGIYNHSLSKRTGIYAAAFQKSFNGDVSVFRAAGFTQKDLATSVGVRHAF